MLLILAFLFTPFLPFLSAHPASSVRRSLANQQDDSGVYICRDVHWAGPCTRHVERLGNDNCIELDGTASSISPDRGLDCIFYANGACRSFDPTDDPSSDSIELWWPGEADLTRYGWNDRVLSYSCVAAAAGNSSEPASA